MGYDGTLKFDTSIDSSGFQDGISKIGSCASTALKATTAIIGGAATAVVGIGTAAIKTGANFESSMSNVAAISGATGDELKSLTDKAKRWVLKRNLVLLNRRMPFLTWRWLDGKLPTC